MGSETSICKARSGSVGSTADTHLIGRRFAWNNTFQYHVFRKLWPEVELNSTFFQDGQNDGRKQDFVTPGAGDGTISFVETSRLHRGRWIPDRDHALPYFNHHGILTVRFPF